MGLYDQDRDLVGYGRYTPRVVWPGEARVAINIIVAYEEGSEASWAAGDGRSERLGEIDYPRDPAFRDFATESVYQYGSRAGVWRLARLLDEFDLKATFLGCSVAFELNQAVADYVHEAGHEPASHGWRWEDTWKLSRDEERDRIRRSVAGIEAACGERPYGWYSRTMRSESTRELLVEEGGFVYDSDAFDDDLPYFVEVSDRQHLVMPYTMIYNDSRYLPGQGFSGPNDFVDHCRRGFDCLWDEGATYPKMMSIGLHPRWAGQPARSRALKDFIEYALAKGGVWFARRIDIARWWIAHHEEW